MPQAGSYEPIQGTFQSGNDARASSFDECAAVFATACNPVCDQIAADENVLRLLTTLTQYTGVPYEFPLGYLDLTRSRLHLADNVNWVLNDDIKWLLDATTILAMTSPGHRMALHTIGEKKFKVKVYKTDRALTGK